MLSAVTVEAGGLFGETLSDGASIDKGPLSGTGRGRRSRSGPDREGFRVFSI